MHGLINYLAGPGRANEHTFPHAIAGDLFIEAWHVGSGELDDNAVKSIVANLDFPRKQNGVKVPRGHVWHCSLSIAAEEGELSDEKWAEIARDFMASMGFDDQEGARAPMRWAAIRHGKSTAGNDHIHLAVQLVREDGTIADTWRDFPKAQKVARELEVKHGLRELETAGRGRSTKGYQRGEREAQARRRAQASYERDRQAGDPQWRDLTVAERLARTNAQKTVELDRTRLARGVRAAAAGARSEAEFVRRVRRQGLLIRPRFADNSRTEVTGFSIAVRPVGLLAPGEKAPVVWYGGNRLAHDLSLPRLREESMWPDSPAHRMEAELEWQAAYKGEKIVRPGAERLAAPTPELYERFRHELRQIESRMGEVQFTDVNEWARLARQASGVFASWSNVLEETPGPLARASDVLAVQATTKRPQPPRGKNDAVSFTGTAILLTMAATSRDSSVPHALLVNQLVMLMIQVAKAAKTAGEASSAARLLESAREQYGAVKQVVAAAPAAAVPSRPAPARILQGPGSVAELPPELRLAAYRPELQDAGIPGEPPEGDPALRMEDLLRASDERPRSSPTAEELLRQAFPESGPAISSEGTPAVPRRLPRMPWKRPDKSPER